MTKQDVVGAVVMSRLMGGMFHVRNIYDDNYTHVTVVIDLKEGDRHIWRYVIADNVPLLPSMMKPGAKTRADFDDEIDRLYQKALDGDEKLFMKGKLMEGSDV